MQTTITHPCGHSETVQLYGTNVHGERDRKAAWMASKPCRECERGAQVAVATETAQVAGFPGLTGSEKQINWALRIRDEFRAKYDATLATAIAKGAAEAEVAVARTALYAAISAHVDAGWWITHRDDLRRALDADYQQALATQATTAK